MDAIMHLVKEGKETLTDNDLDKLVEMLKLIIYMLIFTILRDTGPQI
jgi:hypothetical protein